VRRRSQTRWTHPTDDPAHATRIGTLNRSVPRWPPEGFSCTGTSRSVAAIEANPSDDTPRLAYADWLDERADPRGEYLRTELQLAKLPVGDPPAPDLRNWLRSLRTGIDPDTLARFDQSRVLRAIPAPFPAAWWTAGLKGSVTSTAPTGGSPTTPCRPSATRGSPAASTGCPKARRHREHPATPEPDFDDDPDPDKT
jgi:uncharacterized protein (TIGR02996 family)